MNAAAYISKCSRISIAIFGIFLTVGIGVIDYYTGPDLGVSIFYLVPISLVTWYVGVAGGVAASLASAVTWLIVEKLELRPGTHQLILFWNAIVRLGFFLAVVILQKSLKNEQLYARVDQLTGIGNRRHFFQATHRELERVRRYFRPFTIGYIDIDNFKTVNDTFGHSSGDDLLKAVAQELTSCMRSTDIESRLGGDEFAVFLPEADKEAARMFFDKLNRQLEETMNRAGWAVTFSIGVVTFLSPPRSVDEMLSHVDKVMYCAKQEGKNRTRFEVFKR